MTAVVSKVQVFEKPERHPFMCAKCLVGEGRREFFVHTGMEYDFEGVVYLCDMCLKDMCRQTNVLFTTEDVDALIQTYKDQAAVGFEQAKKYLRAVELLNSIGVDLETMLEGLENVAGRSSEDNVDSESGGSEPEVVDAERNSVKHAPQPDGSEFDDDAYDSSVNPLLAPFKLDIGTLGVD